MKTIVFDMDGTLSIIGDRIKFIKQSPKDWLSFYAACKEDMVNHPVAMIFRSIRRANKFAVLKIVTGRRESCRKDTLDWLDSHGLSVHSHDLHMRADGDTRHDIIVKPELVQPFFFDIEMVFEDRASMVRKWRELGLTCLQVSEGDF